jgi:membrane protease YdiL (CAAX protease family)
MGSGALAFYALAFGWSWACWTALWALGRPGPGGPAASPLFLLGGGGPCVAALLLVQLREPREARRSFWRRAFDPRPLWGRYGALACVLPAALLALALASDRALGGPMPRLATSLTSVPALLTLASFTLWFGPLPEELGWRGFALERVERHTTRVRASLVVGALWAAWHLPLFLIPGTYQAGLGLGTPRAWTYLASMLPLSLLIGWLYHRTGRSTLAAVAVHFSGNFCGALVAKSPRVAALELAWLCAAALCAAGALRVRRTPAP